MPTVIHEHGDYDTGPSTGWLVALVVVLLILLAVFFLWRGGYFSNAPTVINVTPPQQQPAQPGGPGGSGGAGGAGGGGGAGGSGGLPGGGSTVTTP